MEAPIAKAFTSSYSTPSHFIELTTGPIDSSLDSKSGGVRLYSVLNVPRDEAKLAMLKGRTTN